MPDSLRDEVDLALIEIYGGKDFNPNQPRGPHTGEWVHVGGGVSMEEALAWADSAPKGGWGGIVGHSTNPEAEAAIRAGGFDLEHAGSDGEFGPGFYFSSLGRDFTEGFGGGGGHVQAGVRLTKPATPEVVSEVRTAVHEAMGGLGREALGHDPAEFKRRFLAEMRRRGFDGATSDERGSVVAVYDPKAIKVVND